MNSPASEPRPSRPRPREKPTRFWQGSSRPAEPAAATKPSASARLIAGGSRYTGSTPTKPGGAFSRGPSDSQREIVNGILKQLLADPYRWLEQGRDKIDHVYVSDDIVSLTWEDRPILPPFGLTLIERDGRWFLVPPTSYPGVSMVLPRNDDEWYVWGSMVKTLERVVIDLTKEVRSGSIRNMTDLADSATEKIAIPAMLVFFAYGNLMEERKAEAQRQQQQSDELQAAQDTSANAKKEEPTPDPEP